jgi:hypothetical protein
MKLSEWASLAEITSGLAVLVTLILLILGIQENTEVTRVSIYTDLIDSVNGLSSDMYRDPELSRIWSAFNNQNTASLEEAEENRLIPIVFNVLRNYEKAFISWRYGVIGEEEWNRFERAICNMYGNAQAFVKAFQGPELTFETALTDEFRSYLTRSCSN